MVYSGLSDEFNHYQMSSVKLCSRGQKHKKSSCLKALILCLYHHLVNLYQVCSNYTSGGQNGLAADVLEVLHPANFVNITHVNFFFNSKCSSTKIHSWTLRGAMLSYSFINIHSQVMDQVPRALLYFKGLHVCQYF